MQPQPGNRTIPLILGFIIFIIGGWSTVVLFPNSIHGQPLIIPAITLFTIFYIYLFIKWLINPKKFAEQQEARIQKMETTPVGRVALAMSYTSWTVDIQVFKFIYKKFSLFVPFLISIAVIIAVIMIPLLTGYDGQVLAVLHNHLSYNNFIYYTFPVTIFLYSLVCCAIYAFSYVFLGYLLRKKYLNIQESPTAMIGRYLRLSGFIVLLSFTWFIIIFTFGGGRKRTLVSSIANTVVAGIFSVFKLFIYTNLVRVSLGDEKSSFKETYEFVKKDVYQMLRVWFGSGILVGSAFFIIIMALVILNQIGIIPSTEAVSNIVAPAFFIGVILIFVFRAFAEQVGTFAVYLRDKSNVDILN